MTAHLSTRFSILLLVTALFVLHFQLMPRAGHAADRETVSAYSVVHLHKGDCNGECCRGTACCIQAAMFPDTVLSSPPSPRFGIAIQAEFPLLVVKPLYPPPKSAIA